VALPQVGVAFPAGDLVNRETAEALGDFARRTAEIEKIKNILLGNQPLLSFHPFLLFGQNVFLAF